MQIFQLRNGLTNCKVKFEKEKSGRVAFLGGSITFNGGWRDELMNYFRKRFPETKFDFIAAGIPSVGSVGHAFRLECDILMNGPVDLLFVEAAVNDNNYDQMSDPSGLAVRGMEAKAHLIPSALLDPKSYVQGHYGKLEDAKLGNGFALVPSWRPVSGGTRDGFVDVPALVASTPGAELTYEFKGTGVGLFLAAGPDTCVLEFSVDGGSFASLDTYSPWSGGLHLPWPVILAEGLKPGKHKVAIRTTGKATNRSALHIIHLLVNG